MQRSMSIINVTSPSAILPRHRRNNTLILKHEILSEECDMFRASLPRRLYMSRLLKLMGLVVMFVIVHYAMDVNRIEYSIGMVILLFLAVFIILFQTIEERILFIKGLGIQYTKLNGLYQETCNFYPLELIEDFYVFESVDGLKIGHFFNIKLRSSIDKDKKNDDAKKKCKNVVLFENMKPPVEFLKRVYRKFQEIKEK